MDHAIAGRIDLEKFGTFQFEFHDGGFLFFKFSKILDSKIVDVS